MGWPTGLPNGLSPPDSPGALSRSRGSVPGRGPACAQLRHGDARASARPGAPSPGWGTPTPQPSLASPAPSSPALGPHGDTHGTSIGSSCGPILPSWPRGRTGLGSPPSAVEGTSPAGAGDRTGPGPAQAMAAGAIPPEGDPRQPHGRTARSGLGACVSTASVPGALTQSSTLSPSLPAPHLCGTHTACASKEGQEWERADLLAPAPGSTAGPGSRFAP